ncbi:M20 aminoacylase family protein [Microvirga tunisiensis]|uniref:Amidohydrolase n=1 Tax=Microvirga tunisiensis TaxID=2108360 RepID=A0A5N7MHZ3_9HYPH|nr:M20 aminoacylase family protein [Microvirga tunisiensis]MPR07507.1 amidohydrolase [Microvirga tunisiensis]MPR25774.1 amidohydrolase [Microvirga tunisiensis]
MTLLIDPGPSWGSRGAAVAGEDAELDPFVAIRRDLHRHPELAFKEKRTSELVADHLASWGYEVARGFAGTGVVGALRRGSGEKRLGIRADMDALPIQEATGLSYASTHEEIMHACGHDGHTAILLAAAKALADDVDFSGELHLIFQPAEEIGAGARRMITEGLFERFPCDAVFGLHNWPGFAAGQFGFVEGPAMAAVDQARIAVIGQGGHGAAPHETIDPVVATASLITALQSIVSRGVDPLEAAVVTVGSIHGGTASNIIPDSVEMKLTLRSFTPAIRNLLEIRVPALARAQAESFGARAEVDYRRGFPPVMNHPRETQFARRVALGQFGPAGIAELFQPRTASEDFAFFLEARPGAFVFVGNGDSAALHSPRYDFNDAILAPAAAFWTGLAGTFLQ